MPDGDGQSFAFSFSRFMLLLMTPMLAGRRRCHLLLLSDRVVVRMGAGGWAFSSSIPRESIVDATAVDGPVYGWGAHGWRGRWLVNGSSRGLVRLRVTPKARGYCLGFPVRVIELTVSLEQPEAFIAALGQPSP